MKSFMDGYCKVCKKRTTHGFTDEGDLICMVCCTIERM